MSAPAVSSPVVSGAGDWSQRLRNHCRVMNLGEPVWQDVSDRRGGRTAWSCVVVVAKTTYQAKFFYDGSRIDQAREDCAEVALRNLTGYLNQSQQPPPASYYAATP